MLKKLLVLTITGLMLSGCFMAPMAFIGPATSGFTTASIVQSGLTTGANLAIKKSTGKTISEHAFDAISEEVLQQTYLPKTQTTKFKKIIKNHHFSLGTIHFTN